MSILRHLTPRGPRRRLIVLLAGVVGAVVLHPVLLELIARPLTVPHPDDATAAETIVLLDGDQRHRVAADLLARAEDRKILIARSPEVRAIQLGILQPIWKADLRALLRLGVPRERIELLETPVLTAGDLSIALQALPRATLSKGVLILCEELRCGTLRRATRMALGEDADAIAWWPLENRRYTTSSWWKDKHGYKRFGSGWLQRLHLETQGPRPSRFEIWDLDAWVEDELAAGSQR